jgi:site-specific DNA-methyltransferase (adenine-specific)
LRQDIIWLKPNPMPESVTDRCTKAHEYVFLLSKSPRYYFDAVAIREKAVSESGRGVIGRGDQGSAKAVGCNGRRPQHDHSGWMGGDGKTRNRRDGWTIATKPYHGAHFATWPEALVEPMILAGCPMEGVVLDPFAGSGTTGAVALRLGRRAVLVELNSEYVKLIEQRCKITMPLFS